MFKKLITTLGIAGLLGCVGCSKPTTSTTDYSLCNETSRYGMAESKDGFFYAFDQILYYADKGDMDTWIPVCNKPDCNHIGKECNAYLPYASQITQKDGKLYGYYMNTIKGSQSIFEIAIDGSGSQDVYDVPIEGDIQISGGSGILTNHQLVVAYSYLDEKGLNQAYLGNLKDDTFELLKHKEDGDITVLSGNFMWTLRGDDTYCISGIDEEDGPFATSQVIYRINEDNSLEKIRFPEHNIDLYDTFGAYISGDTFTYFVPNEGFYEYNFATKEKTLLVENQLEDSKGYILSEDYFVEWNRYSGYSPEDASVCVYDGEKWMTIEVPENVKASTAGFSPIALGSDRIFFKLLVPSAQSLSAVPHLYYFMLEEENPTLVDCGTLIEVEEVEETEEESKNYDEIEVIPQDITVFDNEQCLFKITGYYIDDRDGEVILQTSLKIKDLESWECDETTFYTPYNIGFELIAINGIEFLGPDMYYSIQQQLKKEIEEDVHEEVVCEFLLKKEKLEEAGIISNYEPSEYTDIELTCTFTRDSVYGAVIGGEVLEQEIVHIYPYGEDAASNVYKDENPDDNILVETDEFKISLDRYEQRILPNDMVVLEYENKTNSQLSFKIQEVTINGVALNYSGRNGHNQVYVSAEKKVYEMISALVVGDTMFYKETFFEETGITEVGVIEFLIEVKDDEKIIFNKSVLVYPNGSENALTYEREPQSTDTILIDNEFITLIAIKYEDHVIENQGMYEFLEGTLIGVKNGKVTYYLKNKTDKILYFGTNDSAIEATVNGLDAKYNVGDATGYLLVLPQSGVYFDMQFFRFDPEDVDDTMMVGEDIEFIFKAKEYKSDFNGRVIVEEKVELHP